MKQLREEKKLNQQTLADLCGVSRQTIYFLEKGSYNPSLTLSFKISEIFSKPIEEIFYFEPEITEIIGSRTLDELEKISQKTGIKLDKITKLKNMDDNQLSHEFKEEELIKISAALGEKFENLFIKEEF